MEESQGLNQKTFEKLREVVLLHEFVAVVDGDVVDSSDDFNALATNASGLASLRGRGAELSIFTRSKIQASVR